MLKIDAVSRTFTPEGGPPVRALFGVSLTVEQHEIVALIGASGCGKSSLLRILAGLDRADTGEVSINGRSVSGTAPEIGVVFQEPRLLPWLRVRDNVRMGALDLPADLQSARVAEALEQVGLTHAADAWPKALSGGMAQRVAIARALVRKPSILLLDEPFSALDSFTKASLQDHLLNLWAESNFTIVAVTHDLQEAAYLADRVIVMRGDPGGIHDDLQIDTARPRDRHGDVVQTWERRLAASLQSARCLSDHREAAL